MSNNLPERRRRSLGIQWAIVIIAAIPPTLASVASFIATLRAPEKVAAAVAAVVAPPPPEEKK